MDNDSSNNKKNINEMNMEEEIIERNQKYEIEEPIWSSEQIAENEQCQKKNIMADFRKREVRQDKLDRETVGPITYDVDENDKESLVVKKSSDCLICIYKYFENIPSALYGTIADELCNYIAINDFDGDIEVLYKYFNQKKQELGDSTVFIENVFDYLFILKRNDYVFCSGFNIIEDLDSFKLSIEGKLLITISIDIPKSGFKKNILGF